jgi:ABC-2 type transport system ATP-binding protein
VIVILSTHIVEDVMDLCTNMAIIQQRPGAVSGASAGCHQSIEWANLANLHRQRPSWPSYEQRYQVVSNRLVGGRPFLHVYSASPLSDGFAPCAPNLEDVFFTKIRSWN